MDYDDSLSDEEVYEGMSQDDLTVRFDNPDHQALASTFEMGEDGEVFESSNDDTPFESGGVENINHQQNLAEVMSEDFLATLGDDIVERVERDITEREPWRRRFERGLELMGLVQSDIDDGAFPGASDVVHPLLVEAVTHIWARTLGELFPAEGPAKSKVLGDQRQDRIERGERVAEYMNYELMVEDEDYINETSRLLWSVPLHGCAFRKTFRDPVLDRNIGIFVPAEDLIVPAEATGLKTAKRFTHRMRKSPNDIRHMQIVGYYRDIEISAPTVEEADEIRDLKNEAVDVQPDGDDEDVEHEIFETCTNLSLPGYEHTDAEGNPTGLELPYIVSVDRHSRQVLSIYAGWKQGDARFRRKLYFTKYSFVPGFGFYDFGLLHLIGGLQAAATGALRVLLDSAATASLSGGFMSKNANLKGETMVVSPGEWRPVDATSEDLQKAFFPIPVKEPSPALFQLLGLLIEGAQRFTATTDIQTGGSDGKNVAVGTITQLLERGEKVMSTIHRLHHGSVADELRLRFELCSDYAPEDGYPYDVAGEERSVYAEDFQPGIDIIPVSDPNIFSSSQRVAIAQAVYEVSAANPDVVPRKVAIKRLFKAMRAPDVDELVPEDAPPQPYDPAGEIQAILLGKPVAVLPEQHHESHLKVLWAFMSNPEFGGNPQVQAQVGPAAIALIGQHLAFQWATAARGMGAPVEYMDPQSGQMQPPQVPPEQIAMMLAQIAPNLATVPGLPSIEGGEGGDDKQADLEIKREELQLKKEGQDQELAHDREKHQQEMAMRTEEHEFKKQELQAKTELKIQEGQMKTQVAQAQAQQDMALQAQQAEQQARMNEQQMVVDQQNMQTQQAMDQQRMAHESEQMQREGALREQESAQDMQHKEQQHQHDQQVGARQDRNSHLR
jgi:hypothetical protein